MLQSQLMHNAAVQGNVPPPFNLGGLDLKQLLEMQSQSNNSTQPSEPKVESPATNNNVFSQPSQVNESSDRKSNCSREGSPAPVEPEVTKSVLVYVKGGPLRHIKFKILLLLIVLI